MADPAIFNLTANTWTKINGSAGITSCQVDILSSLPRVYVRTYVDFGNPAPTDDTKALSFKDNFQFENSVSADVYVKAIGAAGKILVSI